MYRDLNLNSWSWTVQFNPFYYIIWHLTSLNVAYITTCPWQLVNAMWVSLIQLLSIKLCSLYCFRRGSECLAHIFVLVSMVLNLETSMDMSLYTRSPPLPNCLRSLTDLRLLFTPQFYNFWISIKFIWFICGYLK